MSEDENGRLNGWKGIADHFGRSISTVRRWWTKGMPVHEEPSGRVYGVVEELEDWYEENSKLKKRSVMT